MKLRAVFFPAGLMLANGETLEIHRLMDGTVIACEANGRAVDVTLDRRGGHDRRGHAPNNEPDAPERRSGPQRRTVMLVP